MATLVNKLKTDGEIVTDDIRPFLLRYKDGRVHRLMPNTFVPASEDPGACGGVATRDVVIDHATGVSARLFLSVSAAATTGRTRLPLVVYFHGSAFCAGSAFSEVSHRQCTTLSARAGALVVSVDYRLAPEHPIPAAYDDGWAALRWATASFPDDPWLASYDDRRRTFLFGDSAGTNIVHHLAARATAQHDIDIIEGLVLVQPFFWGPERLPCERDGRRRSMFAPERVDKLWPFVTAGAAGNDDPRLNPPAEEVASLRCRRAVVAVASRDVLAGRGRWYASWLRRGGAWCREVALVESEGEDHAFHLGRTAGASAVMLMDRIVKFIVHSGSEPLLTTDDTTQTKKLLHEYPMMQQGTNKMRRDSSVVETAINQQGAKFRAEPGRAGSTNVGRTVPSALAAVERTVPKSCL